MICYNNIICYNKVIALRGSTPKRDTQQQCVCMINTAKPYHTMSHHDIKCNTIQPVQCNPAPYHATPYRAIPCNAMPPHAIQRHSLLCNAFQYNTTPCNAVLQASYFERQDSDMGTSLHDLHDESS